MPDADRLLEAVRAACGPRSWERAGRLTRDGAVSLASEDDEEVVLRVAVPGAARAFTVHLWPADAEWDCDCPAGADACVHVAAAARARAEGAVARGGAAPRVGWRLERVVAAGQPRGLRVRRVAVHADGREEPLRGRLRSGGGVAGLVVEDADLAAEEVVEPAGSVPLHREALRAVLAALADCEDVRLDGEPVAASGQPVDPIGLVEDGPGGGFRVRIVRDPAIVEALGGGAVLCRRPDGGLAVRPVGNGGLDRHQWEVLARGVEFAPEEVGRLVAEVLPRLREHVRVEERTRRLPRAERGRPRLRVETEARGEVLRVRVDVVYGDPPVARARHGRLELLGGAVPVRDEAAEARLARESVERLGLPVGVEHERRGVRAVRLVERLQGAARVELAGEGWRRFRRRAEPLRPRVRIDGDRLDVDLDGMDIERAMAAWLAGERLVPTRGGWAELPVDWFERFGHIVADLLAARRPDGRVPRHAVFDLARLARALDHPPPPSFERLRALAEGFEKLPDVPLPPDFTGELRAYQRVGVNWLRFLADAGLGGILADDMGLGKTVQALAALRGRSLVVCPTSVLHNWLAEARRFRPGLRVTVFHGPSRSLDPRADLTLTTYGVLRNDAERLASVEWDTVVLDEAQAIKNPESRTAQAAFRLRAAFRVTLTGTPVENRLDELWSQFHFLMPGFLGGRREFRDRVERPVAAGDAAVAEHLRRRIRPFVLRRLKREVAPELPPRTDVVLRCELTAEERAIYDAVRAATLERVVRELGGGGGVLAALEALLRLRQAACHPALLPGREAPTSSKVELLMEVLDEVVGAGHKAVVYSQWTSLLDLVEPHLRRAGIDWVRLDGTTRDRAGVVGRFQSPDGPPVFLVSLKAGGVGLNLTAADHVFLLDPWWNPAAEDQAADRAHRIGQERPVMVYRLVAAGTVEERVLALQERKRAIAEAALGDASAAAALTREDLMALLEEG